VIKRPDPASVHAAKIIKRAIKNTEKGDIVAKIKDKAAVYWRLTRMDRPIGTLLLLWPTLWSLWIAAKGVPSIKNLVIFVLGVIVMRAAGCVINDFADRKIDGKVLRTKDRPLATGAVSSREALGLFVVLCLVAFALVLFTDPLTIKLSVGGLILAFCYPFMKRHTHLPQVVLGAAFAWGIPMAYAAEAGELHQGMWLIYLAVVLWTVAYDTFYAMVDRDDDLKIGVKSTAILFGEQDRLMTAVLQIMALYALVLVGNRFELGIFYYLGLAVAAGLFIYQQWLIRFRARDACFKAFLNNNWVGVAIFIGLAADTALSKTT
jgi:4-hydroxybenzoate polyprenyltransferase